MVRVNLINPKNLADQHLVAEYNEILMLVGHLKKHGVNEKKIPANYKLGEGHINFFKNKLKYLKSRHERVKKEIRRRGFVTNKDFDVKEFQKELYGNWLPREEDFDIIKKRLVEKIKMKPNFYRYESSYVPFKKLIKMVEESD